MLVGDCCLVFLAVSDMFVFDSEDVPYSSSEDLDERDEHDE